METKKRSERFLRKRKMLMMLPVLVIPFFTLGFYALGGGRGARVAGEQPGNLYGLNLDLPEAALKDEKGATKLSFYERAEKEANERKKEMDNDPYFELPDSEAREDAADLDELESITKKSKPVYPPGNRLSTSLTYREGTTDPEKKIYEKLRLLESAMNQPEAAPGETDYERPVHNERFTGDVDRLDEMVKMLHEKKQDDPELRQLDTMLEKILDVQHPGRVQSKVRAKATEGKSPMQSVSRHINRPTISGMGITNIDDDAMPAFFGPLTPRDCINDSANTIEAVLHETQSLVNGSLIRLRLVDDINVNGKIIPKDNLLSGIAMLKGERLAIEISSIRFQNTLYPVKLEAYDMDGLPGIYIPGAITRDVAKQSADNGLRSLNPVSLDPSFPAQAATAGIDAAKNLLSRKIKLVKVTVKAGYRVLLSAAGY